MWPQRSPPHYKKNNKQTNKNKQKHDTHRLHGQKGPYSFLDDVRSQIFGQVRSCNCDFFSVTSWSEPEQHSQSKQQRPKFLFSSYICKLLDNEDYDNLLTSILSLKSLNRFQTNIKHLFGRKEKRRERKKKERERKKEKRKG